MTFLERLALSWGLGIGILGLLMFIVSLLGIKLTLFSASVPATILIIIFSGYLFTRHYPLLDFSSIRLFFANLFKAANEKSSKHIWAAALLFLLIVLTVTYVFFDALVKPLVNFDDLWRQGCIAKIIFISGNVITKQTMELAGAHPFLNPLAQAWIFFGINEWNDALGKIIFPLCYLSLLFILYSSIRQSTSRLFALTFSYLFTSFPLIIYHAGTAYSDLMQTFYYSTAAILLFRWLTEKQTPWLYFSALFFGIGNFVKQTGIPLWVAATVVLLVYLFMEERKKLRLGGYFLLISTLISAPWLFYQNSFLMQYLTSFSSKLSSLFGATALSGLETTVQPNLQYGSPTFMSIIYHLGRRAFTYGDWQILWFIFILVIVFGWQQMKGSPTRYLLALILFNLILVIQAFSNPGSYQFLVDGTLVDRLMMYQIPLVLYFIAINTYKLLIK